MLQLSPICNFYPVWKSLRPRKDRSGFKGSHALPDHSWDEGGDRESVYVCVCKMTCCSQQLLPWEHEDSSHGEWCKSCLTRGRLLPEETEAKSRPPRPPKLRLKLRSAAKLTTEVRRGWSSTHSHTHDENLLVAVRESVCTCFRPQVR